MEDNSCTLWGYYFPVLACVLKVAGFTPTCYLFSESMNPLVSLVIKQGERPQSLWLSTVCKFLWQMLRVLSVKQATGQVIQQSSFFSSPQKPQVNHLTDLVRGHLDYYHSQGNCAQNKGHNPTLLQNDKWLRISLFSLQIPWDSLE